MQTKFDDLKLTITFQHPLGQVPSRDLRKTVQHCEEAISKSEFFDIFDVSNQLDLPKHAYQAMQWRLDAMKGETIQFEYAGKGSIILGAVIAATAYWILDSTLGEVFKEAWKETEMRDKVKKILLHRFGKKKEQIAEEIKKRVESDGELNLKVNYELTSDKESPAATFIHIYPKDERDPAPIRSSFTFE